MALNGACVATTRAAGPARPAVFLDKDGTLIDDVPHNVDPALITLSHGAGAGLRRFAERGYLLLVVSNQPGLALGRFDEAALAGVWRRLDQLLAREGVRLDGHYHCPHHPGGTVAPYARACDCRKPLPGLLLRAAAEHNVDLARSWMIGDILHDVEAGRRAGCKTVLIDNGNETEWMLPAMRIPDLMAPDLYAAALLAAAHDAHDRHAENGPWRQPTWRQR